MLASKKYKQAAKELQKLKQDKNMSLSARRKLSEQLKNISQRMKAAARQMKANTSDLKENMGKLSEASENLEQDLQEAQKQCKNKNSMSKECKSCLNKSSQQCNSSLAQMCDSLDKAGTKRNFIKKLSALQKALAKAQAKMNKAGQSQAQAQTQAQGQAQGTGKGVGSGSVNSINTESHELKPGVDSQLSGIKGQGPSDKQIESAAFGSGSSQGSTAKAQQINYKRQMESFIEREDVPEVMKHGVKEYFKKIHQ